MDRGHNSAYNVGFRLVCNADDSVKGTVTTREAANAGANKATGKGKALIIFYSWGGRFGQSLTAISKLAPKATLTEGLSIHYSGGSSLSKEVEKWLKKCGVSHK